MFCELLWQLLDVPLQCLGHAAACTGRRSVPGITQLYEQQQQQQLALL